MSVNNKDTTSADYLDAQRNAISKERAATIAQKAFTPSYTYVLTETGNITDAVDTDSTPAFADGGNITDDISGTVVQQKPFKWYYNSTTPASPPLDWGFFVWGFHS